MIILNMYTCIYTVCLTIFVLVNIILTYSSYEYKKCDSLFQFFCAKYKISQKIGEDRPIQENRLAASSGRLLKTIY